MGEINGRFSQLFAKLAELQPKHQFAFAIVAGNLFAHPEAATPEDDEQIQSLLDGKIDVPVTTYFALGNHPLPPAVVTKLAESESEELCANLQFLGKRTVIKTSEGIRIVALGGQLDSQITGGLSGEKIDRYTPFFNLADASALKGANHADILITAQWPAGVRDRSKVAFNLIDKGPVEQQCVAELCATLKPRYHFSTSPGASFEREPFFFDKTEDGGYPITRFVSLAEFGNTKKQKWISAFSLDPKAPFPTTVPAGATVSPLINKKRPAPDGGYTSRLAFDDQDQRRHNKRHRRDQKKPLSASDCFFCLSNENVPTHLVTSIADNSYITVPKGPLPQPDTFPKLGFPGHLLIIPFEHKPTFAHMEENIRQATYAEMHRYRSSLNKMLVSVTGGELGSVTWELSKSSLMHTHWQYLPVPVHLIRKGTVVAAFKKLAQNLHFPSFTEEDVGDGIQENTDFFRFMIWDPENKDGEAYKSYVLRFDEKVRFHVQFGREVMGMLLKLDNRIDWKACGQTQEEEEKDAARVKEIFGEFDFAE